MVFAPDSYRDLQKHMPTLTQTATSPNRRAFRLHSTICKAYGLLLK